VRRTSRAPISHLLPEIAGHLAHTQTRHSTRIFLEPTTLHGRIAAGAPRVTQRGGRAKASRTNLLPFTRGFMVSRTHTHGIISNFFETRPERSCRCWHLEWRCEAAVRRHHGQISCLLPEVSWCLALTRHYTEFFELTPERSHCCWHLEWRCEAAVRRYLRINLLPFTRGCRASRTYTALHQIFEKVFRAITAVSFLRLERGCEAAVRRYLRINLLPFTRGCRASRTYTAFYQFFEHSFHRITCPALRRAVERSFGTRPVGSDPFHLSGCAWSIAAQFDPYYGAAYTPPWRQFSGRQVCERSLSVS